MKVVHIHSAGEGGAGRACLSIHKALLDQGVDSKVITKAGGGVAPFLFEVQKSNLNRYIPPKNKILRKLKNKLRKRGFCLLPTERYDRKIWKLWEKHKDVCFTSSYSSFDLAENPFVKEADVVHLHWVQDFLDFESFFKKMAMMNKPIVWTFHDLNPMMGGFHYDRVREQYYEEFKMVEDVNYEIKRKACANYENLGLIALSSPMRKRISEHEFYSNKPIYTVLNVVDENEFRMIDRNVARKALGLESSDVIVLYISSVLDDERKGFYECVQALDHVDFSHVLLVCVGDGAIPETKYLSIRHFNSVKGNEKLSLFYSAADYYVNSSYEETFGLTTVEAMLCGTPVVMTPTGIAKDIINKDNGAVCEDFSVESIVKAIKCVLSRQYDRVRIREGVIAKVCPEKIAKDYIAVYEDALKRSMMKKRTE